jgi:hypothetical protein
MNRSLKPLRSRLLEMLSPLDSKPRRCSNSPVNPSPTSPESSNGSLYGAWLASRAVPESKGVLLDPGAQRSLSRENITLAAFIARRSSLDILSLLWELYPLRVLAMVAMDVFKGVFPAFRGYSQALIINEVRQLPSSLISFVSLTPS